MMHSKIGTYVSEPVYLVLSYRGFEYLIFSSLLYNMTFLKTGFWEYLQVKIRTVISERVLTDPCHAMLFKDFVLLLLHMKQIKFVPT